jgi:hypothetical protein
MNGWVRKTLTRKLIHTGPRGKKQIIIVEPNEKLVLLVKFAVRTTACLTGLEIACIVFLHSWSSGVFATITGLIGTVSGVFIGSNS